jgi:hypothetical protein
MKKILCVIAMLCIFHVAFSQETESIKQETENTKIVSANELRLNLLTTIFLFPEITYELCFDNDFGIGLSAALSLNKTVVGENEYLFQITPFFRFYFGSKPSSGFFIETNMALIGFEYANYSSYERQKRTVTDFGLGFSMGYKYFNTRNLIGELYLGLGRTIESYAYPRIGISLGVRFP